MRAERSISQYLSKALVAGLALTAATFAHAADVKVGVISPVTGPVALDGESFRQGAMLAAKQINAAGGVLGGQLQLIVEDGECKPNVSASARQT